MIDKISTVLFDLDGTLLDTTPDFLAIINALRFDKELPSLARPDFEHAVALGTDKMLSIGLGVHQNDADYAEQRQAFLNDYANHPNRFTTPFPGILDLLSYIELNGLRWGIVTNKIQRFTIPLLTQQGLISRISALVCGDSVKEHKPHPEPLLHACQLLDCDPKHCVYIGDTQNDILAGKAAGMKTAAATWGFIPTTEILAQWNADIVLSHPHELKQFIA